MKTPMKHKRALFIAVFTLLVAMLVGCGQSVPDRAALAVENDIVRVTLSFSDTEEGSVFSYSIYQLGEAYYFLGTVGGVELAALEVSEDDMTQAQELAAQYAIKAYLEAYKPPLIKLSRDDEYRTELELRNGTVLSADTAGSWAEALTSFFKGLEAKTASEIPE